MKADLPQYIIERGRARQNEAFGQWVNLEANRQLRNTPVWEQQFRTGAGR